MVLWSYIYNLKKKKYYHKYNGCDNNDVQRPKNIIMQARTQDFFKGGGGGFNIFNNGPKISQRLSQPLNKGGGGGGKRTLFFLVPPKKIATTQLAAE